MKQYTYIKRVIACILACIMVFFTTFEGVSKAYGEGYTHAKQFKNCYVYNGIDVSSHNGNIDWAQVKASGIDFAIIRIGGRGWSQGTMYNDSKALQNLKGAKAAGLKVGVYVFSQAINEYEGMEEALYLVNFLQKNNIRVELPLVMDVEFASDAPTGGRLREANLSKEDATRVCQAFCNTVTANGYTPMIYADMNMLNNHLNAGDLAQRYPIWLANWTTKTSYKGAYSYWQYTSSGTVPGIEGRVDMNFYYSTDGTFGSSVPNIPVPTGDTAPEDAGIVYATHVQTYGWEKEESYDGGISGTVGSAKRLEAIKIRNNTGIEGGVEYQVHCQTYGWMDWVMDGDIAGMTGMAKRLEAIRIRLTGELADTYDVYYRVHCQTFGWLGWAKNGQTAGSTSSAKRLEAIQIMLVEKGGKAPGDTSQYYKSPGNIAYKTHVQTFGWQGLVYDGAISGTTGRAKRLESIAIQNMTEFSGNVSYRVHVQTFGWQVWRKNGEPAGTVGQAKRLEAIQIQLSGEIAEHYDIYYRVHAQTFGWLDWAKNGEPAGTAGYAKRLEAIQIMLVPKNGAAPGSTVRAYIGAPVN
ncbi:MAG: GH25 family lysozyme [Wujia sp.]